MPLQGVAASTTGGALIAQVADEFIFGVSPSMAVALVLLIVPVRTAGKTARITLRGWTRGGGRTVGYGAQAFRATGGGFCHCRFLCARE